MAAWLRAETVRARALRRAATPAERALWRLLRGRRLEGAKFRRQQPLGPFFADFACFDPRLVVEADGAPHLLHPERDVERDRYLAAAGFVVLRLPNDLILDTPDLALSLIRRALHDARTLSPNPVRAARLPSGEGSLGG